MSATQTAPTPYHGYPGWLSIDCGCCAGIAWGGESPETCFYCRGNGALAYHVKTGIVALYPGGPIRWRESVGAAHEEER